MVEVRGNDADRALDLAESVWGQRPLNDAVLRALELAGSYVSVALDGTGSQVGMCLGIVGVHDDHLHLHSHLAAVDPAHRGSGIGRALKRHQREWCLARGITTVSWTFDPLIHANARFNLHHPDISWIGHHRWSGSTGCRGIRGGPRRPPPARPR